MMHDGSLLDEVPVAASFMIVLEVFMVISPAPPPVQSAPESGVSLLASILPRDSFLFYSPFPNRCDAGSVGGAIGDADFLR